MDGTQFDTLARALIRETSRRRTLLALLGGAFSFSRNMPMDEVDAAQTGNCKPRCNECQYCKKGTCRKHNGTKTCKPGKCKMKPNNTRCTNPTGGFCQGGNCACTGGLTKCAGSCRDLQTDAEHCGACANACGAGATCCSGSCKNLQADPTNCGTCGNVCAAPTALCVTGHCCRPPTFICSVPGADASCCSGVCLPPDMVVFFTNHCA